MATPIGKNRVKETTEYKKEDRRFRPIRWFNVATAPKSFQLAEKQNQNASVASIGNFNFDRSRYERAKATVILLFVWYSLVWCIIIWNDGVVNSGAAASRTMIESWFDLMRGFKMIWAPIWQQMGLSWTSAPQDDISLSRSHNTKAASRPVTV